MGFDKRYEGIDEYAVRIIKYKARQLVGRVGFTESDREDLEQEMILDLLQRLPKYDPARAQRNTFIARVVDHKIATIIEARKAGLRDYRLCRCSLDDRFEYGEYEDGFCIERMQIIDQEDYLMRTGKISRPPSELRDLSIDVRQAIEKLPPELRELQRHVPTPSRRSPATPGFRGDDLRVHQQAARDLEDAGLRDYL